MSLCAALQSNRLDPAKFQDPQTTADGAPRASVRLNAIGTLWFNTGTLCNLTCRNCYMESSPTNDQLVYLSASEVAGYLDEFGDLTGGPAKDYQIGFTGGETFMNPEIMVMLADALGRGYRVLILTNAMRPMQRHQTALTSLGERHGDRLEIRISLDHYTQALHEIERGPEAWDRAMTGLRWLARHGFKISIAGRTCWGETEARARTGYARLFAGEGIELDTRDPAALVLFPEMDATLDVPEITESCWGILGVDPDDMMCARSRMVIKRKDAAQPAVVACTLLPYDAAFELGASLAEAASPVSLNHPHCARFCVLGGGKCSALASNPPAARRAANTG